MAIKTYGLMGVDWEERVNFERLRTERLARIKTTAQRVGDGGTALLRHEQYTLHHCYTYRHVGHGQTGALLPAATG